MSLLIILHILFIAILLLTGISVYKKYKTTSGIFFLILCILLSIWYLLYILVFSTSFSEFFLLYSIKTLYWLSSTSYYSMILFVYYFKIKKSNIPLKPIFLLFLLFLLSIIFTDFYISGLEYLPEKGFYYEVFGPGYNILAGLYILFFPIFGYTSYKAIKGLTVINSMRLKYISIGFFIFVLSTVLVLIIFPLLGIILLEQYIIFLVSPFIIGSLYAIHNYHFTDIKIKTGIIFVNILSLTQTLLILYILKFSFINLGDNFTDLWGINNDYGFSNFILGLMFFLPIRSILIKVFLGNNRRDKLAGNINIIKKHIPYITNVNDLNSYLKSEFQQIFKIKFTGILPVNLDIMKDCELYHYFMNNKEESIFINDFVFIEENKNKFNIKKMIKSLGKYLSPESYIIFPLKDNNSKLVGLFILGKKPFGEHYSKDEIMVFESLKIFLEGHLKYIEIHKDIHELSVNLDKKVDEQTIEYNKLINKQKEFIGYVSHEVKGPISSSIFQIDSIIEEVIDDELNKKGLLKELHILNDLLIKTGELVNKLFSIQQFELTKKTLFKEKIQLTHLLTNTILLFKKVNPNTIFHIDFDETIAYILLDKVQFLQVIDNLLHNAIKVIPNNKGEIFISCKTDNSTIIIEIEDNGVGFSDLDIKKIFEKYNTGARSSVGLGMGLYLCKTIVELHGGNIQAAFGKRLGGAKIIIKIPHI